VAGMGQRKGAAGDGLCKSSTQPRRQGHEVQPSGFVELILAAHEA